MKEADDAFSSKWFGDIASTIDGGEGATADEQKETILSCGTDGGSREGMCRLHHPKHLVTLE